MGLMDSLMGAAQQALAGQSSGGVDWMHIASGLLASDSAHGGLAGLLQQLQRSGLGDQLQSWISTGANLPVSGEQMSGALGGDLLAKLAGQAGVSQDEVGQQLSQILPQIIDHLSPKGELPSGGMAGANDVMGMLGGLLARR